MIPEELWVAAEEHALKGTPNVSDEVQVLHDTLLVLSLSMWVQRNDKKMGCPLLCVPVQEDDVRRGRPVAFSFLNLELQIIEVPMNAGIEANIFITMAFLPTIAKWDAKQ